MPMRSEEQRDKCIDVLMDRVLALEAEVARLKGAPPPEENVSMPKTAEPDASRLLSCGHNRCKHFIFGEDQP
jgi:hypothetical protein